MRVFVLSIMALALAACSRVHDDNVQTGCTRSVDAEVTFSNPAKPDHVTASASGSSCAEAAATLTLRNADGKLLWVFSTPYRYLTFGDGGSPPTAPTPEQVDQFLKSWADLTIERTSALPAWPEGQDHLTGGDTGLSYDTHLGREAYEMLRTRDLPEACFAIAVEGSECIIIDPASNEAISMARFGP